LVRHPEHLAELGLGAALVTSPLSSSQAYEQLAIWKRRLRGPAARLWPLLARGFPPAPTCSWQVPPWKKAKGFWPGSDRCSRAGCIPEHRLLHLLRAEGYWPSQVGRALDLGVFRGEIVQLPGFRNEAWGGETLQPLRECQRPALPLPQLRQLGVPPLPRVLPPLGEHRACSTLLAVGGSDSAPERQRVELVLNVDLPPRSGRPPGSFWTSGKGARERPWSGRLAERGKRKWPSP